MKKIIFLFYLLCVSLSCFAQAPCPAINFTYDASGNRILRNLVIVPCGDENQKTFAPDSSSVSNPMIVNVYPNPAQDKINIGFEKDQEEIECKIFLYDLSGKEIYSTVSSSLQIQIDILGISAGTYSLKIVRGKKVKTFNVIKG